MKHVLFLLLCSSLLLLGCKKIEWHTSTTIYKGFVDYWDADKHIMIQGDFQCDIEKTGKSTTAYFFKLLNDTLPVTVSFRPAKPQHEMTYLEVSIPFSVPFTYVPKGYVGGQDISIGIFRYDNLLYQNTAPDIQMGSIYLTPKK